LLISSGRPHRRTASWGIRLEVFHPIVDRLKNIKAPTFVVWGKQDKIIPVAYADVAVKKIPNARSYIFDRCGHWAQFEYPQEFNQLVLEFLQS
jgi:4,5:9,10-diseco-3-hydroxy-5,9,17-trioxoandrosta-1(10),2-diene-4-oate hydrolase